MKENSEERFPMVLAIVLGAVLVVVHVWLGVVGGQPNGEVSVSWKVLDADVG